MDELILLVSGSKPTEPGKIIVHWENRAVPDDQISLPRYLDKHLLQIRAEHMRWAYDLGQIDVGGESLQTALMAGETPSMWWTSLLYERHPKLSPYLYIIYKLRCLELLIEENNCQALRVCNGDPRLIEVLSTFCQTSGRKFSAQGVGKSEKKEKLIARLYAITPAPIRAIVRYIHWHYKIRRNLPFVDKKLPPANAGQQTATIATYFPNIDLQAAARGRFLSRYWEKLHDALNAQAESENGQFVRWLFIRFPAPQLSLKQCLDLRDLFQKTGKDGLSFNYLEEFLTTADIRASFGRWFKLVCKSLSIQKYGMKNARFAGSQINFWPYIKGQWAESFRGWRCLERCLQNRAFKTYYKLAGSQRWNLFPLENCPWERMLTIAARSIPNGPVFGAQHSIVRPTDFRYFDDPRTFKNPDCAAFQPDLICGNGESAIKQWLDAGMPKDKANRVEALRYLYLAEHKEEVNTDEPELPPQPGEPVEMPSKHNLVLLTSFFLDETVSQLALLSQAIKDDYLKDWQITIKPHPYLAVTPLFDSTLQKQEIRIADGPLVQILKRGNCIWASNSTTAALEAGLKGLPVMVMSPVNDFDLCPIQNIPNLQRTGSAQDVRDCLKNIKPLPIPAGYLDLNQDLSAWRKMLNLKAPEF